MSYDPETITSDKPDYESVRASPTELPGSSGANHDNMPAGD